MIKLAVFDMAGTTVKDSDNVHQALMQAMAQFGFPITRDEANDVMGYPKPLAIADLLRRREADARLVDEIFPAFLTIMLDHYRTNPEVGPTPYAEEVFEKLRYAGVKVALDTGFSKDITETILDRLGWRDKIDAWVASDMVSRGRPHPDMIQYLMQITGVDQSEYVAKVGDTIADIEEGRNAGAGLIISITSGAYTREALEQVSPTHLVDNLREAADIILANS